MNSTLVLASNNHHKVEEIQAILSGKFKVQTMNELGFQEEIIENGITFRENSFIKASCIHEKFHCNTLADDSGLEIVALDMAPGVYSARYAGEPVNHAENIAKVLHNMKGRVDRRARFVTTLCLILDGKTNYFEGEIWGEIMDQPKGSGGFGYDPIFRPDGYEKTFAELNQTEKNTISHRAIALKKMSAFLQGII